jgi:ribosome biogenesis protein Nip4
MKKMTQEFKLMKLLKQNYMSSFQMQMALYSSSADRVMRRIRKNPPIGYKIVQRKKDVPEGYGNCFEYKLEKIDDTTTT